MTKRRKVISTLSNTIFDALADESMLYYEEGDLDSERTAFFEEVISLAKWAKNAQPSKDNLSKFVSKIRQFTNSETFFGTIFDNLYQEIQNLNSDKSYRYTHDHDVSATESLFDLFAQAVLYYEHTQPGYMRSNPNLGGGINASTSFPLNKGLKMSKRRKTEASSWQSYKDDVAKGWDQHNYFCVFTYDAIWGVGSDCEEAIADAEQYVNDFPDIFPSGRLKLEDETRPSDYSDDDETAKCLPCTRELFDAVKSQGGEVQFHVVNDVVELQHRTERVGKAMTRQTRNRPISSRTTTRREAMRRRATRQQIREEVRARLERRAAARAEADRPTRRSPSRRRMPASRLAELRREQRGNLGRASLRRTAPIARRTSSSSAERIARLEALREEHRITNRREERLAFLEDKRRERRVAALRERRASRQEKQATPSLAERRARLAEIRSRRRKSAATAPAPAKKRIYVKADNSAGVPAGYYELDEKATRQYQAAKRKEASTSKKRKK